jgi:uronate dehydrogenase|tara:strand:+ start:10685 stop:11452 length:768 start_codon:yes stop_codon:yes gene_type:complete
MKKKKVLLLGATGRVGPGLIKEYFKNYQKSYEIIIGIHRKCKKSYGLKTKKFDLTNIKMLKKAFQGIDVVVNLAANSSPSAKFSEILEPNIIGSYNVFEAARQAKVKRVIFASSVHTVKGYDDKHKVTAHDAPKPLNFYGASKAFGEALCSVFSSKYDLSCFAIRIGAYVSNNQRKIICYTRKDYGHIISQRDMAQLIHKSIIAPKKIKYAILSGISKDKHRHLELKSTKKLIGYKPKDDAYKICKVIKNSRLKE